MSDTICGECNKVLEIGDYPFCPHEPIFNREAKAFSEIVVWQSLTDPDNYGPPGRNDEPCPPGYRPVTLRTLREADKFIAHYNSIEKDKKQMQIEAEKQYWDARTKQRRDDIRAKMGSNPSAKMQGIAKMIQKWADAKREQRYSRLNRGEVNARFQVFANDAGNRPGYSGPETGYREVKR